VIVSVRNDVGLMDMRDTRLGPDTPALITPGEAVAGRILKGLGVAPRPLSLTPQVFANNPLELLGREGLDAARCNRFQRGRTRADAYPSGCARLCQELALAVCAQEGRALRCTHLDTTRFSLSGESVPDSAAHAMTLTPGDAKDHRPDLKPAVWALRVAQDGGGPVVSQRGDGQTADSPSCQARAQAVRPAFTHTPRPRYLVAAATRSHEDKASRLQRIGVITRIPNTRGVGSQVIRHALGGDTWPPGADTTRAQPLALCPAGRAPRWRVVSSPAALERAAAPRTHATPRDQQASPTPRVHWQAHRLWAPRAAPEALAAWAPHWTEHRVASYPRSDPQHDAGNGRPTPRPPLQAIEGQLQAPGRSDDAPMEHDTHVQACGVRGPTSDASAWSHAEVSAADTGQSHVEGSCRFRNDPLLVVSSLCVTQPHRLAGLLMVMTRALLVDSVAPRRLRKQVAKHHETVPHHIPQPTPSPT
jgi:Domain of unknown function (DUF4277)